MQLLDKTKLLCMGDWWCDQPPVLVQVTVSIVRGSRPLLLRDSASLGQPPGFVRTVWFFPPAACLRAESQLPAAAGSGVASRAFSQKIELRITHGQ